MALLCLQVGMRDADYIAAFLHILLPVAFEVMQIWDIWGDGNTGMDDPGRQVGIHT